MAEEKIYTVPLRGNLKVPRVEKANKSIRLIRGFLSKNMHSDNINISSGINELIWRRGAKKPPSSLKVKVNIQDGVVFARLPEEKEKVKEKEEKKGIKDRIMGAVDDGKPVGKPMKTTPSAVAPDIKPAGPVESAVKPAVEQAPVQETAEVKPPEIPAEKPVEQTKPPEQVPEKKPEEKKPKKELTEAEKEAEKIWKEAEKEAKK
jgi:large subunit ribosomal protein L31e